MRSQTVLIGILWTLSALQCQVFATPSSPASSQLTSPSAFKNLSSTSPDPRFRMESYYGTISLSFTSLLLNAVNGMAILAHQPIGQRIRDVPGIVLAAHQDAGIGITASPPSKTFENRIAIWGIYAAIDGMVDIGVFREAQIFLFWDDRKVALITMWKPKEVQLSPNGSLGIEGLMTANTSLTSGSSLRPGFYFLPSGAVLSFQEVFMAVLATLQNLAYWSDTDVIYPFTCKAQDFNAILQVSFDGSPRTKPPYLLCTYVIDVVRQIPQYMLEKNHFADLAMIITIRADVIGHAILYDPRLDQQRSEQK